MRVVSAPMRARRISGAVGGEEIHGVMLGDPEAVIAEGVDVLGEGNGVAQGLGGGRAGDYGGLVEDGETDGRAHGDWMKGLGGRVRMGCHS